jgi:hypothetical protein
MAVQRLLIAVVVLMLGVAIVVLARRLPQSHSG